MSKRPRGRPPIADVPSTARIELRVTPAQRIELRRVASENQTGVAGMLREAVNEYVADYHERRVFNRQKR
jgi:hypothetical protein